ncbi:MAG: hypothetical protein ACJ788_01475, partial [Ktedonobacteraceae bacterium]
SETDQVQRVIDNLVKASRVSETDQVQRVINNLVKASRVNETDQVQRIIDNLDVTGLFSPEYTSTDTETYSENSESIDNEEAPEHDNDSRDA